jgi:hypothetical protein
VIAAALALGLAAAAPAANFGDTSMGKKPFGVLVLAFGSGASFRKDLTAVRAQLPGVAVESVDTAGDTRSVQNGLDRLKGQHVDKVVAIPLETVSESPSMDELRFIFGIRAEPTDDRPDQARQGMPELKTTNKSSLKLPAGSATGPKRLKSQAELVLTATIDKSSVLSDILADRAKEQSRNPAKDAVVLVGLAPRSDKGLEAWKTAAKAIAEQVRAKGGFREAGLLYVRDGVRSSQQEKDGAENKAALRALTTQGGVIAVPLALDGRRVGQLLQRQMGAGGYRWNGKGVLGDERLAEWIAGVSKAAATLPDVRQYRDDAPGASGGFR